MGLLDLGQVSASWAVNIYHNRMMVAFGYVIGFPTLFCALAGSKQENPAVILKSVHKKDLRPFVTKRTICGHLQYVPNDV